MSALPDPADNRILELIERIYDGAADASAFEDVLATLSIAFGARSSSLFTPSLPAERGGVMLLHRHDPEHFRLYQSYYGRLDPWWQAWHRMHRIESARPRVDEDLVPTAVLRRTEFYADFMRPMDVERVLAAIVHIRLGDEVHEGALAFHGASGHRGFTEGDKRTLTLLLPHLQRSIHLLAQLSAARSRASGALGALETLAHGAVLLNRAGAVLHVSASAQAIFRHAGIGVRHGRLFAKSPRNHQALVALVDRACAAPPSGGTAVLTNGEGWTPIVLGAHPLPRAAAVLPGADQARALLLFRDPARDAPSAWSAFRTTFGLTAAELRLCRSLARGQTLAEHSAAAGVTVHTARSQLKAVFSKTAVSRQAELVRLATDFGC